MKSLAIVGPTASGKTALAIELAKILNGEILCCDSMQIYKGMDIGTAKPTKEEQLLCPHHLFDYVDPMVSFSAADYASDCKVILEELKEKGVLPIFCGGTGLYLDSIRTLRHDGDMPGSSPELRAKLEEIAKTEEGKNSLFKELLQIDPNSANATHPNNTRRVIRALEIYYLTGKTKTELDANASYKNPDLDILIFGLRYENKDILTKRIEMRIDKMLEDGLIEETNDLLKRGIFDTSKTAQMAIGYKEILPYIRGEISLEEAKTQLFYATKHYAKRQMTYFKKMQDIHWITMDLGGEMKSKEELLSTLLEQIKPFINEDKK